MNSNTFIDNYQHSDPRECLRYALEKYRGLIALSSSLSIEDQVLTDMILKIDPAVRIFTLDTGRLFPEQYDLIERTNRRYGIKMEVFFPRSASVEKMVAENGINLFYDGVEKRKLCCSVRKIEPLRRAFAGLEAWICGLRREQSVTRSDMRMVEWDEGNGLVKINPLIDWTYEEVRNYIQENNVPYNKMQDNGYPSVGCQPCTRSVETGRRCSRRPLVVGVARPQRVRSSS